VLAHKYLETLPHLAKGGNTFWVIPGELTQAIRTVTEAFGDHTRNGAAATDHDKTDHVSPKTENPEDGRQLTSGAEPAPEAIAAAGRIAAQPRPGHAGHRRPTCHQQSLDQGAPV